jgi:hypothetical protein
MLLQYLPTVVVQGARQPGKPCARASSAGSVLHVRSLDFQVLSFASCACRSFTSA